MTNDERMQMLENMLDAAPKTLSTSDVADICAFFIWAFSRDREGAAAIINMVHLTVQGQQSWGQRGPAQ